MSLPENRKPSPRRLERAGIAVIGIVVAMIVVFFLGRVLWHDEVQETDPASVQAPDSNGTASGTPSN